MIHKDIFGAKMKKLLSIIVAIVLLLSLTACSNQTVVTYSAAWGRTNVNETSVYKVSVLKGENDVTAPRLNGEGTYTTNISGDNDSGYTVTTEFRFEGYYEMPDGAKKDVDDTITTKVVFKNAGNSFAPVSSERIYNGTTIEYDSNTDSYSVIPLSFTSTVNYSEKRAESVNTGSDLVLASTSVKLPKTVYFDNEQLQYALRGMVNDTVYDNGYSTTVTVISGLSSEAMTFGIQAQKGTSVEVETIVDGVKTEFDCYHFYLYKTGGDTGATLNYYFARADVGEVNVGEGKRDVNRSRLIRMTQNIAYTEDSLVYDLVSYDYN